MPRYTAPPNLYMALEGHCERLRKPRLTVLFRRGDRAFGMFLVLSGKVALHFGVDGAAGLSLICGPGTLVGLPATLTGSKYSMTATVTDDADLGFLKVEALSSLLRESPELCEQLLGILKEKLADSEEITRTTERRRKMPKVESGVA